MKRITFTVHRIILACIVILLCNTSGAQAFDCLFKDTIFTVNFGTEKNNTVFNLSSLKQYRQVNSTCPDDGFYSYTPRTSNCFADDWLTINEDHTPNDLDGRMMLVNASEKAGVFFILNFEGFKASIEYEFGVWLMNVCKLNSGCTPLPPNIQITLRTASGKTLADFQTGVLAQNNLPAWKKYFGMLTIPADETSIYLTMKNLTNGGCGNDFAMDDITFRECYPPPPPVIESIRKPVTSVPEKLTPVVKKPVIKRPQQERRPIKKETQAINKMTVKTDTASLPDKVNGSNTKYGLPLPLLTRTNSLVKNIEADDGEITIELYDNGEIDGDTISIYLNNELIVSHEGLSEKPIIIKLKIDSLHQRNELIMVADNLGSIPPNTSVMIVTSKTKRYEIFISSSEQKNAKVIIQKKE